MGASNESQAVVVEKRRFVRYEVDARVEYVVAGQRQAHPTEDLGAGGCRLTVGRLIEKGTVLEVRLTSSICAAVVSGRATVVWASRTEPFQVGLQFSDEVAEQAIGFIHAVLGAVAIHT